MALKVKAVERLLKFSKNENDPGVYRYVMKPELYTNALSRVFDIMVCDACGMDEAMAAFAGRACLIEDWACVKED